MVGYIRKTLVTKSSNPFEDDSFIERFLNRRDEHDSVNSTVDEPTILARISALKPGRVLELGCAAGGLTRGLAGLSSFVLAVDGSQALVKRAVQAVTSPNVKFVCSRFEELTIEEGFDCVVSGLAFHLVRDLDGLLEQVFRWLRPGGHLVFSIRHPIRTACPTGECLVEQRRGWAVAGYYDAGPRRYSWLGEDVTYFHRTLEQMFQSVKKAGFAVCDICEPLPIGAQRSARVEENESVPAVLLFHCVRPL